MLPIIPARLIVRQHDRDFLDRVATLVLNERGGWHVAGICRRYSDMVAHGGRGLSRGKRAPRVEAREKAPPREKPAGRPALSNKEQHALTTLPRRWTSMRAKRPSCKPCSTTPIFTRRSRQKFARAGTILAETRRSWPARRRNGWSWNSFRGNRGGGHAPPPTIDGGGCHREADRSQSTGRP